MEGSLGTIDIAILLLYSCVLIGMGVYYSRKCRTAEQFMVADRTIPAWAIFALCILPVAWLACKYAVPYYRRAKLISVYSFLEERLGAWGRIYAAFAFVLYMIGRVAVILFLASVLLEPFVPLELATVIIIIGLITIVYTLLGGMEAVIWTDVMQSIIMIVGIIFCAVSLSIAVFSGPEPLIQAAIDNHKFSFGSLKFTLASQEHLFDRTVWVMIIYGITEALRSLLADQNYVQKYCSVPTERDAKRSVWIAMLIYIPLTAVTSLERESQKASRYSLIILRHKYRQV